MRVNTIEKSARLHIAAQCTTSYSGILSPRGAIPYQGHCPWNPMLESAIMRKTDEERLLELAVKRAALEARMDALTARQKLRVRKHDTRRKIILGGALLELAERDPIARELRDRIVASLTRTQDRKAFDLV